MTGAKTTIAFAQLTGQRKFEMFLKSEIEVVWEVVSAHVYFREG
jgi:hypothetical protein